jgi:hypothetical protein
VCQTVYHNDTVTKTQVHLTEEQLALLRRLSERDGKSVAAIIREAIGVALSARALQADANQGPVALWTGKIKRRSMDHDSIYDEP